MSSPSFGAKFSLPPLAKSLSLKLLLLTVFFVMLAEVLIYCPSVGRFRLVYLQERLDAAHLAILALEATPNQNVGVEMEERLMAHVGAYAVSLQKPDRGRLMLMVAKPEKTVHSYDLRDGTFFSLIGDAFETILQDEDRIIRAVGPSPKDPRVLVEVVMNEAPLKAAMLDYSGRILALSLVISLFTAALVYLSLHLLLVRPMRRITRTMVRFRENPEDASRDLDPSSRSDEVGLAERELVTLQAGLRAALLQKTHLAALGIAVTKINHDLRNILSTAFLMSDRLTGSADPEVRRLSTPLVAAIDRAVKLCTQTLNFAREGPLQLRITRFSLREVLQEIARDIAGSEAEETFGGKPITGDLRLEVAPELMVEADREQLYRALYNLIHNALVVGSSWVRVSAGEKHASWAIEIADDGPGLPPRARQNLFQPFAGSARKGGTGLGLAIARDILRAHGGDIELIASGAQGTVFRLQLPRPRPQTL